MTTNILSRKLFEIERAIGVEAPRKIRMMVIDAQDCMLQMQRELVGSSRRPHHSHQGVSEAFHTAGA
jgi:hypothetical protein